MEIESKEFVSRLEWILESDAVRGSENWLGDETTDEGILLAYYRTKDFTVCLKYDPKTRIGEI